MLDRSLSIKLISRNTIIKEGPKTIAALEEARAFESILSRAGVSTNELRVEQLKDAICKDMIKFVEQGVLPDDKRKVGYIKQHGKEFTIVSQLLFRNGGGDVPIQLVVPPKFRPLLLEAEHGKYWGAQRCRSALSTHEGKILLEGNVQRHSAVREGMYV